MPGDGEGWDGATAMGEILIMDFSGSFPKLKSFFFLRCKRERDRVGRGGGDLIPERWRPLGHPLDRLNERLLHYIKSLQIQAKRASVSPQGMLRVVSWEQAGKTSSLITIHGQERRRFLPRSACGETSPSHRLCTDQPPKEGG